MSFLEEKLDSLDELGLILWKNWLCKSGGGIAEEMDKSLADGGRGDFGGDGERVEDDVSEWVEAGDG